MTRGKKHPGEPPKPMTDKEVDEWIEYLRRYWPGVSETLGEGPLTVRGLKNALAHVVKNSALNTVV